MIINTEYITTEYVRTSKLGNRHVYTRQKTIIVLRCDCCGIIFTRSKGSISPDRVSNQVYHVCATCNVKQFAQSKGVERRTIWKMPVSSLKTIDHL